MEYGVYHLFYFLILIFFLAMLEVIVERATRHLLEFQQQTEVCVLFMP